VCFNDNEDRGIQIEDVEQTNTAAGAGQTDTVSQSNGAQVTQNIQAVTDCDEENTGDSSLGCDNNDPEDLIDPITQTNDAPTVGDDTVQSNFVGITQDVLLNTVCDENGVGDNAADCTSDFAENNVAAEMHQSNTAIGSGDADFTQNNNIPTINQVIAIENDCDQIDAQTASGSNFAACHNDASATNSFEDEITQSNVASGTHVDDIFQDNIASFSQVMTIGNDCDSTTFTDDGDNNAVCSNDNADNRIDPVDPIDAVSQTNSATGNDDVLIDQDNNLDVSQALTAVNDCDSTAENNAQCSNLQAGNFIDSITQDNTAIVTDLPLLHKVTMQQLYNPQIC
jgi:hypothetical protein